MHDIRIQLVIRTDSLVSSSFPKGSWSVSHLWPASSSSLHLKSPRLSYDTAIITTVAFPLRCPSCEWEATQGGSWRRTWEERRFHGGILIAFLDWHRVCWEDWPKRGRPIRKGMPHMFVGFKTCVFSFALSIRRLVNRQQWWRVCPSVFSFGIGQLATTMHCFSAAAAL